MRPASSRNAGRRIPVAGADSGRRASALRSLTERMLRVVLFLLWFGLVLSRDYDGVSMP